MIEKLKPSKYQKEIYEWIKTGNGNCVIEAIAGSGKTSVLKEIVNIISDNKRILMIAFNKSIVDELQRRIQLENVKIQTSHGLGFAILKKHFKYCDYTPALNVDEFKYRNYIKKQFKDLTEGIEFADKIEADEFKEVILALIDMCRFYLCETNEDIEKIAEKYNYAVNSDHIRIIKNCIKWGKENLETIDFGDMIALPNYFNLSINSFKYDWILSDESQDFSVAQQELVKRCIKKNGTRCVFVGDGKQAIQSFAGADNEAFQKLKQLPNTISLPLSLNYRCPRFVEDIAKRYVPEFEVFNKNRNGIIKHNVLVKDIKDDSIVICRKTQPLIEMYLRLIKDNRKCYIKGLDIGQSIVEIIEKLDSPYISTNLEGDGIIPRLYKQLFSHRESIIKKFKIDIYDATNESSVQQKLETINVIKALSDGIDETYQLIDRCKKIFNQTNEGICLITNHKAKGLENDVVYHLCPSLLPDKRAKKDWEVQTERNLEYVLYTRTKNEFYTISEEDFPPPQGSRDVKEMISYLNNIEQKLKILYDSKEDVEKSTKVVEMKPIIPIIKTEKSEEIHNKQNNLVNKLIDTKEKIRKFERIMVGKKISECYEIFNDFGITSDIRVVSVNGKELDHIENGSKDTINVDVDNIWDKVVMKIVGIGKPR